MIREDVHSFGLGAPAIYVEYHRRSVAALVTSLEDPSERHQSVTMHLLTHQVAQLKAFATTFLATREEYQEKSTLSSLDDTMLPEVHTDTVACIYNVDRKCKGMLTPERLNILQKAFHRAKCNGLHDHVKPPPI